MKCNITDLEYHNNVMQRVAIHVIKSKSESKSSDLVIGELLRTPYQIRVTLLCHGVPKILTPHRMH